LADASRLPPLRKTDPVSNTCRRNPVWAEPVPLPSPPCPAPAPVLSEPLPPSLVQRHPYRMQRGSGSKKASPRGGPMQFSSLSPSRLFSPSISPALAVPGWRRRGAAGVGRALPAAWQALPLGLPGFSGLTLAFQRLEVQSRRRAALAASLFPNIERQREKSLLLPAHQSHHHHGRWPSPPKNNRGATGHARFPGTKGDNAPRGSRDGAERRRAGGNLGLFPPLPSTNKAGCVVAPAVLLNSDQGRLSLFVCTSGIQPVPLRTAANCLFPAGCTSLPIVLTRVRESTVGTVVWVTLAQSCSCLKPRSPPRPPPPPGGGSSAG